MAQFFKNEDLKVQVTDLSGRVADIGGSGSIQSEFFIVTRFQVQH